MELTIFWEHRVSQSFASVKVWIKVRGKNGVTALGYFTDRVSGGLEGDVGGI